MTKRLSGVAAAAILLLAATSAHARTSKSPEKQNVQIHNVHHVKIQHRSIRHHRKPVRRYIAPPTRASSSWGHSDVVAEARRYLGTNPTGRRSLWCGAFMDLVLRRTGHPPGGNLALAYARYPGRRLSGPQVGAIAVMGRRGGGHVGVVSGVTPDGNPIIISGNHRHTTAEAIYPRGRIYAYVMPS